MERVVKAAMLCVVATATVGVASASVAADAKPEKPPAIHMQGSRVYGPTNLPPGTIRGYGNVRHAGHLGCSVWEHPQDHPKQTKVRGGARSLNQNNDGFLFYVHNLNPNKKYYFKLRCGHPLRTVAADSAFPVQPAK